MPNANCYEAFNKATAERKKDPLPRGEYKLRECRSRLVRCKKELVSIQRLVSGKADRWALGCCTSEDKHIWLKRLPEAVAHWLGWSLIPGLHALTADGVSAQAIESISGPIGRETNLLLSRLEAVRQAIAKNIDREYERMRSGTPMLEPLVDEAIRLTDLALSLLPESTPVEEIGS
jgi:hypothetical protein